MTDSAKVPQVIRIVFVVPVEASGIAMVYSRIDVLIPPPFFVVCVLLPPPHFCSPTFMTLDKFSEVARLLRHPHKLVLE